MPGPAQPDPVPAPDAAARAAARADWPIRCWELGKEPADDLSGTTPAERLAMVWQVTLDAWRLAGLPLPQYRRSEAPGRLSRLGETP